MSGAEQQSGHRARLRQRFLEGGATALAEYELLEMLLFAAHPRGDTKPLAKRLLKAFGHLPNVIQASPKELAEVEGMGEGGIAALKAVEAASAHLLRRPSIDRPVIQSWTSLLDYCRSQMAHQKNEQVRVLYLNNRNALLKDEVVQEGTVSHAPIYPREIVRKALDHGATAFILVHNHPSGDATPSDADVQMTQRVQEAAAALGILLHDHVIIAGNQHFSFKSSGLL